MSVTESLTKLRKAMRAEKIDWYYMTSSDFHESEYVADYFKVREHYSGFTGENAFLLINSDKAFLWTDGRFFIQATNQLKGTGIDLMKMAEPGVPTVLEFMTDNVKEGQSLAVDGRTVSLLEGRRIKEVLDKNKAKLVSDKDIAGDLWENRPSMPCTPVYVLSEAVTGEGAESKLKRVREQVASEGAAYHFLSKIDDIMWILNIRANDIECNPVALSYMFITPDTTYLFIQKKELDAKAVSYLEGLKVVIKEYDQIIPFLTEFNYDGAVALDDSTVSFSTYEAIAAKAQIKFIKNPSTLMKAMKNQVEIKNLKKAYLDDSVCVTKFIYWLKHHVGKEKITEISAADVIDNLRRQVPGFIELSFPTISGYGTNGAIVHYSATEESNAEVKPEGMLLVDSGGTYENGTTDVTRTISCGPVTDKMRLYYTKTAVSNLNLLKAKFLYGCTGRNLDIIARLPLWELGYDYKHGTGHGVGHILNVHEGPQTIRWQYNEHVKEWALEPGMVTSDEPGVYLEGEFGIRIESIVLCVEDEKNSTGRYLKFEPLTYAPLDRALLDKKALSPSETDLVNAYQKLVYETIKDLLTPEEAEWLKEETLPL